MSIDSEVKRIAEEIRRLHPPDKSIARRLSDLQATVIGHEVEIADLRAYCVQLEGEIACVREGHKE